MRFQKYLYGFMVLLMAIVSSCSRPAVAPQQIYPVTATISAFTVDSDGIAISVPVIFKIYDIDNLAKDSDQILESLTFQSDDDGYVEYRHEFFLQQDERSRIVVDVSSPKYESVQYWTAYFSAADAPAKRMEIGLVVFPK